MMDRYHCKHRAYSDNERVVFVRLDVCLHLDNENADNIILQSTGTAICHPDDRFNYSIGHNLALARALKRAATELAGKAVDLWDRGQSHQHYAYDRVNNLALAQLDQRLPEDIYAEGHEGSRGTWRPFVEEVSESDEGTG